MRAVSHGTKEMCGERERDESSEPRDEGDVWRERREQ